MRNTKHPIEQLANRIRNDEAKANEEPHHVRQVRTNGQSVTGADGLREDSIIALCKQLLWHICRNTYNYNISEEGNLLSEEQDGCNGNNNGQYGIYKFLQK